MGHARELSKLEDSDKIVEYAKNIVSNDLSVREVENLSKSSEVKKKNPINRVQTDKEYDYILIDCPPTLSLLTINALAGADGVIIPMQCEYYALEGLADLTQTIDRIQQVVNPNLEIVGVVRTMYDARNALTRDVAAELEQYFGKKLYDTVIPRNVRLAEAPAHGLPVIYFEKSSKGAVAYLNLAAEIVKKIKKGSPA